MLSPANLSEFQSFRPTQVLLNSSINKGVLMGARVRLFEIPVSLPKTTFKSNITLCSLSAVTDKQLISVGTKVVQL